MIISAASQKILFDFQTTTNVPPWQIVNDDVMGGKSSGSFRFLPTGSAVFSGTVSLENNGGFASVRSSTALHDLTGCNCFGIRFRGDGRRYKFTARTDAAFDTPLYQCPFLTKFSEWEEQWLPFKFFVPTFRGRALIGEPPLNPAKVSSVGFLISDHQEGPFKLEVAWIKAAPGSGD